MLWFLSDIQKTFFPTFSRAVSEARPRSPSYRKKILEDCPWHFLSFRKGHKLIQSSTNNSEHENHVHCSLWKRHLSLTSDTTPLCTRREALKNYCIHNKKRRLDSSERLIEVKEPKKRGAFAVFKQNEWDSLINKKVCACRKILRSIIETGVAHPKSLTESLI